MSIISQAISSIGYSQGPRSISAVGYLAKEQTGRSGYWRLFFTQLQEQSLEKKKEKPAKPFVEPYKLKELEDGSVVVLTEEKKKPKKVVVEVEKEEPVLVPLPPFKPVLRQENPVENIMQDAWKISMQIRTMLVQYQIGVVQFTRSSVLNEEDDIEALLLLA